MDETKGNLLPLIYNLLFGDYRKSGRGEFCTFQSSLFNHHLSSNVNSVTTPTTDHNPKFFTFNFSIFNLHLSVRSPLFIGRIFSYFRLMLNVRCSMFNVRPVLIRPPQPQGLKRGSRLSALVFSRKERPSGRLIAPKAQGPGSKAILAILPSLSTLTNLPILNLYRKFIKAIAEAKFNANCLYFRVREMTMNTYNKLKEKILPRGRLIMSSLIITIMMITAGCTEVLSLADENLIDEESISGASVDNANAITKSAAGPMLTNIAILSDTTTVLPGETVNMTLLATYANGSTKYVTSKAKWAVAEGVGYFSTAGVYVCPTNATNKTNITVKATYTENRIAQQTSTTLTVTIPKVLPLANAGENQVLIDEDGDGIETVNLDGSISKDDNGITSYLWSEGSKPLGTDAKIATSLSIGRHILTLTVADEEGLTNSDTVTVSIHPSASTLTTAFDIEYSKYHQEHMNENISQDSHVYYLRQELQALVDMWRATGNTKYLTQAKSLVFKAIKDGMNNSAILYSGTTDRGVWPCYSASTSPTHSQLNDFQGSAGFMLVAMALYENGDSDYQTIAKFVEEKIFDKWLNRNADIEKLTGEKSLFYLLVCLDSGRDKREQFATLCMDLNKLGFNKYPYDFWAKSLTELYIGTRSSLNESSPFSKDLNDYDPMDWGVIQNSTGGFTWYWNISNPKIEDTSHANRTVWLVAKAYDENLINQEKLTGFINTFKNQIWSSDRTFYFKNYIDGSDNYIGQLGPGRAGNVWFGWNRLAAYDSEMKDLFISLAYDVALGGKNILPYNAQNKAMDEGRLCLLAWGTQLLSLGEN